MSIEHLYFPAGGDVLYTIAAADVEDRRSGFTIFGGDQHNAVGASCTIDCSGDCVFQDTDVLDVVAIEILPQAGAKRKSVYDIQRGATSAQRTQAPHIDLKLASGYARGLSGGDTWRLPHQQAGRVGCRDILCRCQVDAGDRPCHLSSAL